MEEIEKNTENNNPLVSIVVITYNSAKYVLETLESAKAQTYQNIELIVSDDCSTDNTVEICRNWIDENKDRFVRTELITVEKNTGIAPNCNRGLYKAEGEWVKFIAGDDLLLEECVEDNINYIRMHVDVKVVFSVVRLFKVENNKIAILQEQPLNRQKLWYEKSAKDQFNKLLYSNFNWATPSSFIYIELIRSNNCFDEKYPFFEDYPLWIKLTKNNIKLNFFDKPTVLYRQSESITRTKNVWINESYFKSYKDHFNIEIKPYLIKMDRLYYLKKSIKLFQYNTLIYLFNNKHTFSARIFNKALNILVKEIQL